MLSPVNSSRLYTQFLCGLNGVAVVILEYGTCIISNGGWVEGRTGHLYFN